MLLLLDAKLLQHHMVKLRGSGLAFLGLLSGWSLLAGSRVPLPESDDEEGDEEDMLCDHDVRTRAWLIAG